MLAICLGEPAGCVKLQSQGPVEKCLQCIVYIHIYPPLLEPDTDFFKIILTLLDTSCGPSEGKRMEKGSTMIAVWFSGLKT